MGRQQSKFKKPNNPLEALELKQRRQQEIRVRNISKIRTNQLNVAPGELVPSPVVRVPQNISKDKYDQLATDELRKQLQTKFSTFILNQLLLSIQFYGNFEREKLSARERCAGLEKEMNEKLQTYSIILPNVLDEALEKHVRFQQKHGHEKDLPTKLHTQTIYIVLESVEISKSDETNYEAISPICKVFIDTENIHETLDQEKMWKGYVRLKFGQAPRSRISIRNINSVRRIHNITNYNGSSIRNNDNQVAQLPEDESSNYADMDLRGSISSYTNSSTRTYDYAYIINLNSHHPLSQLTAGGTLSNVDSTILPDDCITNVIISTEYASENKSDGSDSEDDQQSDSDDEFGCDHESELLEVRYLNSKEFLRYFANLLKEKLASELDITEEDLSTASWKGASVFTSSYEIVPALHFPHWPACAFEWTKRKRNIHINPLTGEKLVWPTPEMIKCVVSFGCHAIPLGYASKKGRNPTRDLEWKIVFPEAERYLESHLSNTQVKVYMLCKALIRTYVEPLEKNDVAMFSLDHLRTHLFLLCEENYAAWPEEFLGEALLRLLKSFLNRLSSKKLPDYFISERNLFENIPESNMVRLHQIISQIIENPVMHVMMAYRNLNLDGEFYPKLNYKKLYAFIVVDDPLVMEQMARSIRASVTYDKTSEQQEVKLSQDVDSENEHQEGLIGYSHKKEMRDRSKRRKTKKLKQQEKLKMLRKLEAEQKRRASEDSIDLQFIIKDHYVPTKNELRSTPDEVRRAHVIKVFVNFFISMAKAAYKLKIFDQCKIYLSQASKLCILLNEYCYEEYARQFLNKIEAIKKALQSSKQFSCSPGPALPLRKNLEPVRSFRQNNRVATSVNDLRKLFDEATPETSTKVVQFKEECNFIEPRSFFGEVEVHKPSRNFNSQKESSKPNGILKQPGHVRNDKLRNSNASDPVVRDDESVISTEL